MSEPKVRRFSRFAIIFHWMVGIPYMALLATGGLILLQRTGFIEWHAARLVDVLHLWIGIGLAIVLVQGMFAAIVSGRLGAIRKDLADWIILRPRDVVWLLKVPLNIFWPHRFHLPPVGRFNAGQKIHGLFIVVALIAFVITGVLIIFQPADLRPWIIHSWLFYFAAGFLAIHLFLGLINRATRPALGGIFTGYVPRDYVANHHPLELDEPTEPRAHAVVSWRALAAAWAVALFAAVGFLHWYGPERATQQVLRIQGQQHASISPGALFAGHANDARITSCQTCHQSLQQPPDIACLTCHTEIQTVMQRKQGIHGTFVGTCRECHVDHKGAEVSLIAFDTSAFNHDRAQFSLAGKHRTLDCAKCHLEHSPTANVRHFIGITQSCNDCHTDPHEPSIGIDCQRCHSPEGWTDRNLLFVHNRDSTFKIDAIHSSVACTACHQTSPDTFSFRLDSKTCQTCHATITNVLTGNIMGKSRAPDPHSGRLECTDCHTPEIHDPTPAQYASRCAACHSPRYRGLLFDWQRSLDERTQAAQTAIKTIESADPGRFATLSKSLESARLIGMHNVQSTMETLEEIGASTGTLAPSK